METAPRGPPHRPGRRGRQPPGPTPRDALATRHVVLPGPDRHEERADAGVLPRLGARLPVGPASLPRGRVRAGRDTRSAGPDRRGAAPARVRARAPVRGGGRLTAVGLSPRPDDPPPAERAARWPGIATPEPGAWSPSARRIARVRR